jgi:serine phosphatase RsbU (regulator of sigma subunit)
MNASIAPVRGVLEPRGGDAIAAIEALAAAAGRLVSGGELGECLDANARAAALAAGADVALVRTGTPGSAELVTRAVHARSAVVAAELAGSRLDTRVLEGEREYADEELADAPAAVRRAAARAGSGVAHLVPVPADGDPVATLELYREGAPFSEDERAIARLAAAHVALALELAEAVGGTEAGIDRTRVALELVGEALAAGSDEAELAEHIVRTAADATGAARCLLWRIEADSAPVLLAAHGLGDEPPDLEAAGQAVGQAIERRGSPVDGDGLPRAEGDELVVPLGEPPAGALQLGFAGAAPPRDPEILDTFGARAAVALRRTRRAQLVAIALRRSQAIVAVISQAIARLSLSHTLETAVERISELTASGDVAIYLREGDRLTAAASRGLRGSHTALAERLLELALGPFRGRGFLFIPDLRRDPRVGGLEDVLAETGVRRALVVPLVVREEVIGALAVYKQRPRPYRSGEEGLLIALSSQLAVAVQNARLHERTKQLGEVLERTLASERRAARQLRGLFEISHSFARSLSLEATLQAVAKAMVDLFELDAAAIRIPSERGDELVTRAIHVGDDALAPAASAILAPPQPVASPLARRVLESRERVVLSPRDGEPDHDPLLAPFLAKGSTAAVLPLATPGEAIGTLTLLSLDPARPLDPETVEAATTVSAQAALAIENARLYQQQKDFAETMQRTLLPSEPPSVAGIELGHVYQSAARVDVGGDLYDFLALEDGRIAVLLGDVTGKGIQAAADMAMAKFAFRALVRGWPAPDALLERVNDVVVEEIAVGKFITALYAVVDPRAGELCCANAGHPPLRLVRPGHPVVAASSPGLALGVESSQQYRSERVELEPGASVVLFTDGLIEARRDGDLYGEARLDAFLAEHAALGAQELADAVVADCRAFSGGDLADDCAVVVLRLRA